MPSLDSLEKAADSFGYESSWEGSTLRVRVPNVGKFQIALEEGKPKARASFGVIPERAFRAYLFVLGVCVGFLLIEGFLRRGLQWLPLASLGGCFVTFSLQLWLAQRTRERLFTRATELERGIPGLSP